MRGQESDAGGDKGGGDTDLLDASLHHNLLLRGKQVHGAEQVAGGVQGEDVELVATDRIRHAQHGGDGRAQHARRATTTLNSASEKPNAKRLARKTALSTDTTRSMGCATVTHASVARNAGGAAGEDTDDDEPARVHGGVEGRGRPNVRPRPQRGNAKGTPRTRARQGERLHRGRHALWLRQLLPNDVEGLRVRRIRDGVGPGRQDHPPRHMGPAPNTG